METIEEVNILHLNFALEQNLYQVEDANVRLREVRSRLCTCDYPEVNFKCHCCRIIKELFGDIGRDK